MGSEETRVQRRRSERVTTSLPIVVRGVDLLGQEFEERTATLSVNLHGCRYASRYHLPKNTWITVEVARGSEFRNVRARVAWIQRPHSVREFFQINAELEAPQNLWFFEEAPPDWSAAAQSESQALEFPESETPASPGTVRESVMDEINAASGGFEPMVQESEGPAGRPEEHPLLRDFRVELGRGDLPDLKAAPAEAVTEAQSMPQSWIPENLFDKWKQEFAQVQRAARETLAGYQGELLEKIRSEFDAGFGEARLLIERIEKSRDEFHVENEAAGEIAARSAQERPHPIDAAASDANSTGAQAEEVSSEWQARLHSQMNAAQTQWNELLQCSLDSGLRRMVAQFSESSREIAREAELKFSATVAELGRPVVQNVAESREALASVKSALDGELARAQSSLTEIHRMVSQVDSSSAQIEMAAREALDELNRRLRLVLDAQTREMGDRAETLTAGSIEKAAAALDALTQRAIGDAAAEIESKLAPHMNRLPEILSDLSMKELQVEESLRLHRERLRQISESSERDLRAHLDAAVGDSRQQFGAARQDALEKVRQEFDFRVSGVSEAAAQAMNAASQGFEETARERLQAVIEQGLAAGTMTLTSKAEEIGQNFAADLEAQSSRRAAQIREQLNALAAELTGHSRTQIEQAAEATASAFGQVLRGISDQEIEEFTARTAGAARETSEQLETSGIKLLRNFETSAESSRARFHQEIAAQLESSIAQGRTALSAEFTAALAAYRLDREANEKEWAGNLERLSEGSLERYQERVNTAGDSFVVSSVRRLNEHGQHGLEALMRSADKALRESCAKLFDGLAEILRERSGSSEFPGSASGVREAAEAAPPPLTDSELDQP